MASKARARVAARANRNYFIFKVILFIFFLCWLIRALLLRSKHARRVFMFVFGRFVGNVSFQYNRGLRHVFLEDFEMVEPPQVKPNYNDLKFLDQMANYSMDKFYRKKGFIPFEVTRTQCNETFQRLKSYLREFAKYDIPKDCGIKMVNVDYKCDVEYWVTYMRPMLLFTFVPDGVAGTLSNGGYNVTDNHFKILLKDAPALDLELWNYGQEYITVDTLWGVIICPIEQLKTIDEPCLRVIFILPATFVPVPFSGLVVRNKLEKIKVSYKKDINVLRVQDDNEREFLSIAIAGSPQDNIIPMDLFQVLKIQRDSGQGFSKKEVEKFLKKEGVHREHVSSVLIYDMLAKRIFPPEDTFDEPPIVPNCNYARYAVSRNKKIKKSKFEPRSSLVAALRDNLRGTKKKLEEEENM